MIPEIISLSETAAPACPQCGARTVEGACTLGCKGEGIDNRDIIEALATRVMGWRIIDMKFVWSDVVMAENHNGIRFQLAGMVTTWPKWDPLTDPAASDQLLDRMRELGWKYRIIWNGKDFTVTMQRGKPYDGWGFSEAESDTQKMAVAMACLKAVEGKWGK